LSAKVSKGSCEYATLEDSDTQEHTELEDDEDEEDGGDIGRNYIDSNYCQRSGSWPPKSKRALGKNTLIFWMACMSQTMDKYPELLYEEWKGKKPCLIRLGQMISHVATNLEMTWKLATNTFARLLLEKSS